LKRGFHEFDPGHRVRAPDPPPTAVKTANPYDNASCEISMKTLKRKETYAPCILTSPICATYIEEFIRADLGIFVLETPYGPE
jgi:hypothetical protein